MMWEYMVEHDLTHAGAVSALNVYGDKGWELVSVVSDASGKWTAFFKRRFDVA
jgi:hypothetical protein